VLRTAVNKLLSPTLEAPLNEGASPVSATPHREGIVGGVLRG